MGELTTGDFTDFEEPWALFHAWMAEATASEPNDPTAMALATVDAEGLPNVRMVLLKGADENGFVFYTNVESNKGRELTATPKAALVFHWKSLRRQIRARGPVLPVSDAEADAYFATRGRGSQLGAWASRQSEPMADPADLARRYAEVEARFAGGSVPRPPFWSGFRLAPERVEFWIGQPSRLHVRHLYSRDGDGWRVQILYP